MPSATVQQRVRSIVEEFSALEDSIDRYRQLVALGETMPALAPEHRTEETRLPGCQYGLWIRAAYDPAAHVIRFQAHSDARITRGLAALIIRVLDGQAPETIAATKLDFLDGLGLQSHLSVHRNNGLLAMIEQIRRQARLHMQSAEERSRS